MERSPINVVQPGQDRSSADAAVIERSHSLKVRFETDWWRRVDEDGNEIGDPYQVVIATCIYNGMEYGTAREIERFDADSARLWLQLAIDRDEAMRGDLK